MAEAKRTIDLMWFPEQTGNTRGRRQGLSVPQVVRSAIALADADGLDAVTMRRIAQDLGVVPMTLYTYVPDKAALLDLMLDRLYLEMPRAPYRSDHWRDRLSAIAEENYRLYQRHPWAAGFSASRPPLGPGLMAKYEHELRAFENSGLDDVVMDSALTFLLGFVQSSARAKADADALARSTAKTDYAWWEEGGPVLEMIMDPDAFPHATRVGAAAGEAQGGAFNPDHAYEFGLARVLDGLGVLIGSGSDARR